MDHETVLRTEIEEMGRPGLVVRVPWKDPGDLRALRSFVIDSLALGVLVIGQGVTLSLEHFPDLGGVACTWSDPWADDEQDGSDEDPDDEIAPDDPPFPRYVGYGAKEKNQILARLTAYRKDNGLGCLAKVAGLAGKPVTDELIRELITEGKKIPMEVWRQIGAALDALEQEDSHE